MSDELDIDWSKYGSPEFDAKLGLPSSEIHGVSFDPTAVCLDEAFPMTTSCSQCMKIVVDGVRRNVHHCCSRNPETGEINPETGYCPNINMKSGKCKIYMTEQYPQKCLGFHCDSHNMCQGED